MSVSVLITPGKRLVRGEKANNAKLNQLGRPTIIQTGSIAPANLSAGDYSAEQAPGACFYGVDAGVANALVVTVGQFVAAYADGMQIACKVANANTGATTLALNGLAAVAIHNLTGLSTSMSLPLVGGELQPGMIAVFRYQAAAVIWQLVSVAAAAAFAFTFNQPFFLLNQGTDGGSPAAYIGYYTAANPFADANVRVSWSLECLLGDANYIPQDEIKLPFGGAAQEPFAFQFTNTASLFTCWMACESNAITIHNNNSLSGGYFTMSGGGIWGIRCRARLLDV